MRALLIVDNLLVETDFAIDNDIECLGGVMLVVDVLGMHEAYFLEAVADPDEDVGGDVGEELLDALELVVEFVGAGHEDLVVAGLVEAGDVDGVVEVGLGPRRREPGLVHGESHFAEALALFARGELLIGLREPQVLITGR